MTQTPLCRWRRWRWWQLTGTGSWLCLVSGTPPTPGNSCLIGFVCLARFIWFIATESWQSHICISTHWLIYCSGNNISVFIGPKSDHCLARKFLLLWRIDWCETGMQISLDLSKSHATSPCLSLQNLAEPNSCWSLLKILKLNVSQPQLRKSARQRASCPWLSNVGVVFLVYCLLSGYNSLVGLKNSIKF